MKKGDTVTANIPLRLRMVLELLETTIGPLLAASLAPQFIGMGLMPICLGYVLSSRGEKCEPVVGIHGDRPG